MPFEEHRTLKMMTAKVAPKHTRTENEGGETVDRITVNLTFDLEGVDPTATLDHIRASEFVVFCLKNPKQTELFKEEG